MGRVKHTKNELKRQKDDLKRFIRYLPTLALKKQQLQAEIIRILHARDELEKQIEIFRESVYKWVAVFAEEVHIEKLVGIEKIRVSTGNIAGIGIPVFEKVDFRENNYDIIKTPLWVDYGIEAIKELATLKARSRVLEKQLELVREELRITTQRVNLFEKIKIPQARENIRRISIFLGDLQTAAVVTGKISKNKIEKKAGALASW
ncbi:MAG: V-type ATP synthase subunit D [Candidatus Omnitrophota bacterium]|nr:MAG: V-type ATP synthase subunit D [Candidatus Omnitrophota bacterium]